MENTNQERPVVVCAVTNKEVKATYTRQGNVRLPAGWKRIEGKTYSKEGWKSLFRLSAVIIPIAGVYRDYVEGMTPEEIKKQRSTDWQELNVLLKESWSWSTSVANWAVQYLLAADTFRMPGEKLAKMPQVNLYNKAKDVFDFTDWSTSANAVLRTVEQTYRSYRGEMLGYGRRRLPDFRYPYPYLISAKSIKVDVIDRQPIFSIPFKGGRVRLSVRGGHRYRRQLGGLLALAKGTAIMGEGSIYRKGTEVMLKVVGYFPRRHTPTEGEGVLTVSTTTESFLVAVNDKEERLFIVNGDRMKRELLKHSKWQQREREDQKFETRKPHRTRKSRGQRMSQGAEKNRHRLDSFIKETASQIVNYAVRRKLGRLVYNGTNHEFFGDQFPYYQFGMRLEHECDEVGLIFEKVGEEEPCIPSRSDSTGE